MKVIFLDIDGVLNSHEYWKREGSATSGAFEYTSIKRWVADIDPRAVKRLNRLIRKTGAKVVLSTSWRQGAPPEFFKGNTLEFLQEVLEMRGFRGKIIGETPYLPGRPRSDEIRTWAGNYKLELQERREDELETFVVLDDDADADIEGHFVRTSAEVGLTDADVVAAKAILEGSNDGRRN